MRLTAGSLAPGYGRPRPIRVGACGTIRGHKPAVFADSRAASRRSGAWAIGRQESSVVESDRTRGVAARLLAWLAERGLYRPGEATPVDALVGELGLDVVAFHPASRREGTLGWLEPDEPLIYLREDLPEPVRRFTLAHELGHAVLHRPGGLRALTGEAGGAGPSREVDGGDSAVGCDDADLELLPDALAGGDELLRPGEAYSARAQR